MAQKKEITKEIDEKYIAMKNKAQATRELYHLGYDIGQICFILGLGTDFVMARIGIYDILKRCENLGDEFSLESYYKITGIEFSND